MKGEAIRSHLLADSGVAALCKKIFPADKAHGVSAPAIVYEFAEINRDQLLQGVGSYRNCLVDFECWALKYADAHAIADAVESALIDFVGTLGTSTPSIDVDHCRLERRFDIQDRDAELYGQAIQFFFGYEQA